MIKEKFFESLDSTPDFLTFPKTFENYAWYKPLIVGILAVIIFIVFQLILLGLFAFIPGSGGVEGLILSADGGYDTLNAYSIGGILSILAVVVMIPALYISSRFVNDRPVSSYLSSRGGWNWSIFLKSVSITFLIYFVVSVISAVIDGRTLNNQFTLVTFIIATIIIPLQCVAEEYFMRGYVMQMVGSWFNIPVLAIFVQALFFASLHPYNILGVVDTLIIGICWGAVTYYTKGIEMSSAIHVVNNLMAFWFSGLGLSTIGTNVSMIDFVSGFVTFLVTIIILFYVSKRQNWFEYASK